MTDIYQQKHGFVDIGTTDDGRVRISIGTFGLDTIKTDTTALVTPQKAREIAHDIYNFASQAERQTEKEDQ